MAITLHLTDDQARGLEELMGFANRGREDSLSDFDEVESRWSSAVLARDAVAEQLSSNQDDPVVETVVEFVEQTVGWVEADIWGKATCDEAELAARLYRLMGMPHVAEAVIVVHTGSDYEEDEAHIEYYGLSTDEKYELYRKKHTNCADK